MSDMPIPPSLWRRMAEFVSPGRHGKIELDVKDGRVVGMRLLESVKPTEERCETEKEPGGMVA